MRATLEELAGRVGAKAIGPADLVITGVNTIDRAGEGEITFLTNPRYARFLPRTGASAIIVAPGKDTGDLPRLEADNPYLALAKIVAEYCAPPRPAPGVDEGSFVDPSAEVGEGVRVFPGVYVGPRARIGPETVLYPGVFIGEEASVGADCRLYPNVVVLSRCRLGDRVICQPGVVIGGDGFGFAPDGDKWFKILQLGVAEIGDDVELQANTCVDRAAMGATVIESGVKADNLVQLAHGVHVGRDTVIAALTGVAGSTTIGRHAVIAAQVGIAGHLHIGDGATLTARAAVMNDVDPGEVMYGVPARKRRETFRLYGALSRLPETDKKVRALERRVEELARRLSVLVDDEEGKDG
ncbi:MAG: UDP-3-O-(3-hydroxymyristoyl)glucosamine N-acyltransferase [Proteobacteria bacterium]|nr:UDP-3-O-(3-hydroxymyristoyl)glucosamine N-acyltransferase [Pseudomonadota bacterium]